MSGERLGEDGGGIWRTSQRNESENVELWMKVVADNNFPVNLVVIKGSKRSNKSQTSDLSSCEPRNRRFSVVGPAWAA